VSAALPDPSAPNHDNNDDGSLRNDEPATGDNSDGVTRMTKPTVYYSYADGSGRSRCRATPGTASTRAKLHKPCERHTPASG
jgi:hypothetical protein